MLAEAGSVLVGIALATLVHAACAALTLAGRRAAA
jgi:hypothetical protein